MSIEMVLKSYETALNNNDIESILSLFGSEPVFMPQNAPALEGREAVRAGYEQVFDILKLTVQFTIHDVEIAGEWAWARTTSSGVTKILEAGIEVSEGNNELFILRKESGDWKIHRYLFATSQPRA
ncbi:nuclear transport factor 2 family protein [Pseudomonas sp. UYIF39]|uniref:YybH family protein n=1 Tax=Pseudomonas sp. UYIF39 TaxID=1630747 RepID=UPI00249E0CEA|nr:nuclear transport factor 2 family protein [Pseudomonas sp. UYIF39]MDI3357954.1 nuclear transport factor 2 family protein [Pseudomonas sp. UYIF39]